jgi:hypothetical protein
VLSLDQKARHSAREKVAAMGGSTVRKSPAIVGTREN